MSLGVSMKRLLRRAFRHQSLVKSMSSGSFVGCAWPHTSSSGNESVAYDAGTSANRDSFSGNDYGIEGTSGVVVVEGTEAWAEGREG